MLVKLKVPFIWSGRGSHTGKKGAPPSGMLQFRPQPGGTEIPDALFPYLPKSAEVLEGPKKKNVPDVSTLDIKAEDVKEDPLHAFDPLRAAADDLEDILDEVVSESEKPVVAKRTPRKNK